VQVIFVSFEEHLREMRRGRRLTLGQLALRAGVNKATLSRWETGAHAPRVPELLRALNALEASTADRSRALTLLDTPRAVLALREDSAGTSLPVSLGTVLYSLRRRAGTTQAEAARTMGVSRSLIAQWEHDDARPSAAQRHALGFVLGASAEEVGVLSTRAFAQAPVPLNRDALLDRYQAAFLGSPDATEASERLVLLALLGGFGRLVRAGRADVGDMALIVSNFAAHAGAWHNDRRARDFYRRRTLALAAEARAPLHFHIVSSVRVLLDSEASPQPLGERMTAALAWQDRFSSQAGQAYLLSFLAATLAQEAPEEALRLGDRYCALVADDPDELPCRLHDRGNLLRRCGRAAESVASLAALTPQDTFRAGLIQMDMARGLTELGAKAEASRCLSEAEQILAGTQTAQIQAEIAALSIALG